MKSEEVLKRTLDLPLFHGVDPAQFSSVNMTFTYETFKSGQRVIDADDNSSRVFFLLSGCVIPICWTSDGREVIFPRLRRGACFGEMAAIDSAPRSLAAYAHERSEVASVTKADFRRLIDLFPPFRDKILKLLTSRIRELTKRVNELSGLSVEARVKSYLLRSTMELGIYDRHATTSDMPTHAEIAASIGANREAVSRVMSRLNKSGVIESRRNMFRLLQPDALLEAAGP